MKEENKTESKWERELKENFYQPTIQKEQALKDFISRIEKEAFEKGKEQTLEEVEKKIEEMDYDEYSTSGYMQDEVLQTIKEMKTK